MFGAPKLEFLAVPLKALILLAMLGQNRAELSSMCPRNCLRPSRGPNVSNSYRNTVLWSLVLRKSKPAQCVHYVVCMSSSLIKLWDRDPVIGAPNELHGSSNHMQFLGPKFTLWTLIVGLDCICCLVWLCLLHVCSILYRSHIFPWCCNSQHE